MMKPTRILVPTDFSEHSGRAFAQALDIAKQYHAKIYLLHVIGETDIYSTGLFFDVSGLEATVGAVQEIKDRRSAYAGESLQKQLDGFSQAKEVEVITSVREGVPYEEILKEGEERGIDLIVIASLGRSGIARYLLGNVARNVVKGSKCSVLVTK
jgi:universal stress protein A